MDAPLSESGFARSTAKERSARRKISFPNLPPSVPLPFSVRNLPSFLPLLFTLALCLWPFSLPGCGIAWTLPRAHFEGVDEEGYVAYWEKIGEADLGDGLIIPVHIGFNSHRESSSPTLGKGWVLPLLESHVEPIDENTLHVIMPDGWTFLFLRNGNTDTWRGNAGWVGQTDGSRFTITAPCGWRVKFDAGKIQEIDTPKNRTIAIKYNGPAPVEADIDNQPFLQVEQNTATGVAQNIIIGSHKIAISQAQRPRIQAVSGKTLLAGFDSSLSQIQWPDGKKETFDFAVLQDLMPKLTILSPDHVQRNFTWDVLTKQILSDNDFKYGFKYADGGNTVERDGPGGVRETYSNAPQLGKIVTGDASGKVISSYCFTSGPLAGKRRQIIKSIGGIDVDVESFSYDEKGQLIRKQVTLLEGGKVCKLTFSALKDGSEFKVEIGNEVHRLYIDSQGNIKAAN
jgi:hypothetical protein